MLRETTEARVEIEYAFYFFGHGVLDSADHTGRAPGTEGTCS